MNSTINISMGGREWFMLIVLSILWGGSFFFVGVAVSELPPLTIVTLRVGLAAITLWGVVIALKIPVPSTLKAWKAFLFMGMLNNVIPFTLIVWGLFSDNNLGRLRQPPWPVDLIIKKGVPV
ncbi:EamA family transporter [Kiloniella sp.]|uniref:EamA family transporter n=1 Tax=Kiloniella sp. TaxID=1938587 RepID=UPI003B016CDF